MNAELSQRAPLIPAPLVVVPMVLVAAAAGRFIASGHIGLGFGIVVAIPVFALVFIDLSLAIALWVGLLFVVHLSILSIGPTAISLLLFLAWVAAGGVSRGRLPVLRENGWVVIATLVYATWLTVSAAWAFRAGDALAQAFGSWWQCVAMFLVVATTLTNLRDIRLVALAFVIGSVVSVVIGLIGYGGPTGARAAAVGNRLTGGGGDPNYQASAFVAAMFIAGGLVGVARSRRSKLLLALALALIAVGFLATESRGGLIALVFATIVALVLLPEQRRQVMAAIGVAGLAIGVWVMIRPSALSRITDLSGNTSGRGDQWTVAWRIFKGHPFIGIGLNNFRALEPRYVLEPGNLTHVRLVAETPEIVHNAYLQLLAETGVVGLMLFLVVVFGCLRTMWLAIGWFDAIGEKAYANLSRAVLIGTIAMLAAMFFISNADDLRLWVLFAMGPALLTLARHHAQARPRARAPEADAIPPAAADQARHDREHAGNGSRSQLDERDLAMLRLLRRPGMSFEQVAKILSVEPSIVRARTHAALARLGGRWSGSVLHPLRVELGDYLLGQQSSEQARHTREVLASSAPARSWARVVNRELKGLGLVDK